MANSNSASQVKSFDLLWFVGWLFSIGYLKLGFWKGVLAILVWPYFIGADMAKFRSADSGKPSRVEQTDNAQ